MQFSTEERNRIHVYCDALARVSADHLCQWAYIRLNAIQTAPSEVCPLTRLAIGLKLVNAAELVKTCKTQRSVAGIVHKAVAAHFAIPDDVLRLTTALWDESEPPITPAELAQRIRYRTS